MSRFRVVRLKRPVGWSPAAELIEVPDAHHAVLAAGGEATGCRVAGHGEHLVAVRLPDGSVVVLVEVPDAHGAVGATGDEAVAPRAEGDRIDGALVSFERLDEGAIFRG